MTLQNFSSNAESHARTFSTTRLLVKCTLLTLVLIAHCTHISDFAPMIRWKHLHYLETKVGISNLQVWVKSFFFPCKCIFIFLFCNIEMFFMTIFLVENWKRRGITIKQEAILRTKQYILGNLIYCTFYIVMGYNFWKNGFVDRRTTHS